MSSFALPLALFEGTSWQMLVTSSVHEGRAKVNLDLSLPISKVLLTSAQDHDVLMAARIGPNFGDLARLSAHLAMESPFHLEAIKARLARQTHLAMWVHMLSRCESDRFESDKMPSWYMSHNTKH